MTSLSPHFSLEELTFSQTALRLGLDNTPPPQARAELIRLCETLLEPGRVILAPAVWHVDSGYRSPDLNTRIGGASASAHMEGRAADVIPIGLKLEEAFERLRTAADLPYDQIIIECGAWLHLAIAPEGTEPRREALTASGGPGAWHYARVS